MATIRIQFPERDTPTTIVLRGKRITVGRTPNNTIQILDRTLSGRHAELFEEDGHYRVHDAGSSNGVFVNGNLISDFHLHEACKVTFGSVECDYDPNGVGQEAEAEELPTHAELATLRDSNAELSQKLQILQDELSSLHLLRPAAGDESTLVIPQSEHEKVAVELATFKENALKDRQQVASLNEELAITRRDNDNLQHALDVLKAALDKASPFSASTPVVTASASAGPVPAAAPVSVPAPAAAAPVATPAPAFAPKPSIPVGAPKPAIPLGQKPAVAARPSVPSPLAPKPAGPATPLKTPVAVPSAAPAASAPKPTFPSVKAGPPGMISSGPPKAPGAPVPMAKPPGMSPSSSGLPKPGLKPSVPSAVGMPKAPNAPKDGTKTQKIES